MFLDVLLMYFSSSEIGCLDKEYDQVEDEDVHIEEIKEEIVDEEEEEVEVAELVAISQTPVAAPSTSPVDATRDQGQVEPPTPAQPDLRAG